MNARASFQASGLRDRIVGNDIRVPLLDGTSVPYVNFDNAASTPALRDVIETVTSFLDWYSAVHRGAGFKSRVATETYEDARRIVGDFVGADPADHVVIFGKNATEAINKLAWRFPFTRDDVVLVSTLDHHSNDLPWRGRARVEHIAADALGRLDETHFDHLLKKHAGQIRLVAITGGSNVTGEMPCIHGLAERTHAAGAQILVDCAQLAPHRAIEIGRLDDPRHLDYVALSAHKMYAPFGTGALIGRRDTFQQGTPEHCGGRTISFVSKDAVQWADAPERDEAGSPNVVGAVAMAAAAKALTAEGMTAIALHETRLTARALERLSQIEGIRVFGDIDPARAKHRLGVIAFTMRDIPHGLVSAILSAEFGIGVRDGCFCAHPYLSHLLDLDETEIAGLRDAMRNGDRSRMPGMVRVSFGAYNTLSEVDRVADALCVIARGGQRGTYVQDRATGTFAPMGWSPDPHACFSLRSEALPKEMAMVQLGSPPEPASGIRPHAAGTE